MFTAAVTSVCIAVEETTYHSAVAFAEVVKCIHPPVWLLLHSLAATFRFDLILISILIWTHLLMKSGCCGKSPCILIPGRIQFSTFLLLCWKAAAVSPSFSVILSFPAKHQCFHLLSKHLQLFINITLSHSHWTISLLELYTVQRLQLLKKKTDNKHTFVHKEKNLILRCFHNCVKQKWHSVVFAG